MWHVQIRHCSQEYHTICHECILLWLLLAEADIYIHTPIASIQKELSWPLGLVDLSTYYLVKFVGLNVIFSCGYWRWFLSKERWCTMYIYMYMYMYMYMYIAFKVTQCVMCIVVLTNTWTSVLYTSYLVLQAMSQSMAHWCMFIWTSLVTAPLGGGDNCRGIWGWPAKGNYHSCVVIC